MIRWFCYQVMNRVDLFGIQILKQLRDSQSSDPFAEGMLRYCICYYKFDKYHCIMNTLRYMKQDQRKVAYLSLPLPGKEVILSR